MFGLCPNPKGSVWFEALIRTGAVDGIPDAGVMVAARLVP